MTAGPAPVRAAGHRRTPRVLAVLLAALLLLFSVLTITQSAAAHQITLGSFNTGAGLLLTLWVIAAVGLVVAWHQPGNPIGWLLPQLFFFPFIAFPLIIWLFPDGRLLPDGQLAQVENPSSPILGGLTLLFFVGLLAGWLSALVRQAASWRRSSGERRQQLKWLMSGAAVCGVFAIASFASNASLWEILIIGIIALPVSIGIGILKYRLYDIDRIISRTLAYAIITGLLVGLYAGLVLLATQVLRFSSPVAVAVAVAAPTLAAAALFNPVRRRVQRAVDRRFNRARYDADAAVEAFATRLAGAVALPETRAGLVTVIDRALEPAHLAVWLAAGDR